MAARIASLDHELADYGAETTETRHLLNEIVGRMTAKLWPAHHALPILRQDPSGFRSESLYNSIEKLSPRSDLQRALKTQTLSDAINLGQMRWLLAEQAESSISSLFLVIVISWLALLFLSFALFAPPNAIVIVSLVVASLSVSGGILLILELDRPFDGFIKISSAPMRATLRDLAH